MGGAELWSGCYIWWRGFVRVEGGVGMVAVCERVRCFLRGDDGDFLRGAGVDGLEFGGPALGVSHYGDVFAGSL